MSNDPTDLLERVGKPSVRTTYHCQGCPALVTKDWVFHEENDGVDRGTDAKCTAIAPAKHIGSYWTKSDRTPEWCPALIAKQAHSEVGNGPAVAGNEHGSTEQ